MSNLINFLFLAIIFWSAFSVGVGQDNFTLPDETPGYQGKEYQDQVYYGEDGSCGWWNDEHKKYVQPNLKYQAFDFKCLNDFHWHAYGPACGDPYYEYAKYCAMVKFYENQTPKQWLTTENKNNLLVLVDGCLVCEAEGSGGTVANPKDSKIEATVKVQLKYSAGSFFSSCSETNYTAREIQVTLGNASVDISEMSVDSSSHEEGIRTLLEAGEYHYASFSLAAELSPRKCHGLFTVDPIQPLLQKVMLIVEHNCKGARATSQTQIQLGDLRAKQFKNNWAELRGLYINLMNPMDARQYSYVEFRYIDLAESLEGVQWFNLAETEDDGF